MRLRQLRRASFLFIDDLTIGDERTTLELLDHTPDPETRLLSSELGRLLQREISRHRDRAQKFRREAFDAGEIDVGESRAGERAVAHPSRLVVQRRERRVCHFE